MKDGGPAFPALHSIDGNWVKEPLAEFRGMSLTHETQEESA